jgi:hypothetical protein
MIDSISHRHDGTQQIIVQDNNSSDAITIPLDLARCMIHFRHRLPTIENISTINQYCLKHGDGPWNPSSFSDQVADKFHQRVIDTEITMLVLQIILIPVLLRLTQLIESCPSMTHQIYLHIILG